MKRSRHFIKAPVAGSRGVDAKGRDGRWRQRRGWRGQAPVAPCRKQESRVGCFLWRNGVRRKKRTIRPASVLVAALKELEIYRTIAVPRLAAVVAEAARAQGIFRPPRDTPKRAQGHVRTIFTAPSTRRLASCAVLLNLLRGDIEGRHVGVLKGDCSFAAVTMRSILHAFSPYRRWKARPGVPFHTFYRVNTCLDSKRNLPPCRTRRRRRRQRPWVPLAFLIRRVREE